MRIERTEILPYSPDVVFEAAREGVHLLDQLPDLARVEPISRRVGIGWVERTDRFRTRMLGVSRRALPTVQLTWQATSRWDSERRRATWNIVMMEPATTGRASGTLALTSGGDDETHAHLTLDVHIDHKRMRRGLRVLSFVGRPMVERFAKQLLERNVSSLFRRVSGLRQAS